MSNDYVFVLMESEMHEGTYLRGIFTDRYSAEEAMKRLEEERDDPDVFSFWIDTHYLNQIIRD
jgi:macrodomain Ter protein organizer (MatP/YcbG family)